MSKEVPKPIHHYWWDIMQMGATPETALAVVKYQASNAIDSIESVYKYTLHDIEEETGIKPSTITNYNSKCKKMFGPDFVEAVSKLDESFYLKELEDDFYDPKTKAEILKLIFEEVGLEYETGRFSDYPTKDDFISLHKHLKEQDSNGSCGG